MCGISGILTNSYDSNDEAIVLSKLKLMTDLIVIEVLMVLGTFKIKMLILDIEDYQF